MRKLYLYAIAFVYMLEIGQRFGWSHWADRSDAECVCSGICFVLFAIAAAAKERGE